MDTWPTSRSRSTLSSRALCLCMADWFSLLDMVHTISNTISDTTHTLHYIYSTWKHKCPVNTNTRMHTHAHREREKSKDRYLHIYPCTQTYIYKQTSEDFSLPLACFTRKLGNRNLYPSQNPAALKCVKSLTPCLTVLKYSNHFICTCFRVVTKAQTLHYVLLCCTVLHVGSWAWHNQFPWHDADSAKALCRLRLLWAWLCSCFIVVIMVHCAELTS